MSTQPVNDSTLSVGQAAGDTDVGSFWSQLQPASFRGVPFKVKSGGGQFGRRNAVHEYPFRDTPWVEDLGKQARRFQVVGYVIGDDVIAQRAAMIDAVESPGDGELVHPTHGRVQVALIGFDTAEDEHGRTFEYRFTFVRQGQRLYPSSSTSTTTGVSTAAAALSTSGATAFATKALTVLSNGAAVINSAAQQAAAWANIAQRVGNDATSLIKLAVTLPGQFGRLLGLASGLTPGQVILASAGATVADLVGASAVARATVASACATLVTTASQLGASSIFPFTSAAQALTTAILTVSSTPGDALRGLSTLAAYSPATGAAGDELVAQSACADLFRRAAVGGMALASSNYQPQSSDDAATVRTLVLAAIDNEITIAGDQFEDDVYSSMRMLRAQVVQDLNSRGAQLPTLVTVSFASSLPALALAQRLYRDAGRADELVARANPIHPAFMPRSFEALNS